MSANIRKRGRPLGSSQYARGDEHALDRMDELVRERQPVATAARTVVVEMTIRGPGAEERLRKKFSRRRTEIAARMAARSSRKEPRPPASGAPVWGQILEAAEFLKSPEGKAAVEHARSVAKNKALVMDAAALARLLKR